MTGVLTPGRVVEIREQMSGTVLPALDDVIGDDELRALLNAWEAALETRGWLVQARRCLVEGGHSQTCQGENQCLRHIDGADDALRRALGGK